MTEAEALAAAASIRETMQTDGWRLMRKILEEQIAMLDTIKGVTSLKDLQARQHAHKALSGYLNELDAILGAEAGYVNEKTMRRVQDPIFRVVQ